MGSEMCIRDSYNDILPVDLEPALKVNSIVANKLLKHLYATIDVAKKPVCFQLDGGASCKVQSNPDNSRLQGKY